MDSHFSIGPLIVLERMLLSNRVSDDKTMANDMFCTAKRKRIKHFGGFRFGNVIVSNLP